MRTVILSTLLVFGVVGAAWTVPASAESQRPCDPSRDCVPIAQLPLGLGQNQTMRLNVTCLATSAQPVARCPVTLRFMDDSGRPVRIGSAPLELRTTVPVRGVASLDLPGHAFVPPALRRVVRAVVLFDESDFFSDRLAMNVEVFQTATGRADIRYVFEPCRTLPFAFVPSAQRPAGFPGDTGELSFAPPGATTDEDVTLNVICNPDPDHPRAPCHLVLRYSPFESGTGRPRNAASPIAERTLTIPPGSIGSFVVSGDVLGATPGHRVMFRPSVVGTPEVLGRLVTSFEVFDAATGDAHSLYQPQIKKSPLIVQ